MYAKFPSSIQHEKYDKIYPTAEIVSFKFTPTYRCRTEDRFLNLSFD